MSDFGRRAEDLSKLLEDIQTTPLITMSCPNTYQKSSQDDGILRIAFIGDSYVWGQGLTNTQLASVKLEKLLSKKTKTKVYLFGNPGDTIVDNYIKYRYVQRDFPLMDLYIFGMVDNDLLFQKTNGYSQEFFDSLASMCPGELYFQPTYDPFAQEEVPYYQQIQSSFSETYTNTCVLDLVTSVLPKDALFLNYDDYQDNEVLTMALGRYVASLQTHNLQVISMKNRVSSWELEHQFISEKEKHPSSVMNTRYAEVLSAEIEKKFGL